MNIMTSLTPDQELASKEKSALRTLIKLIAGESAPTCPGRYYDLRDLFFALRAGREEHTPRHAFVLGCLGKKKGGRLLSLIVPFLDEYFSKCRDHKTIALLEFSPREERDVVVRLLEEFSEALGELKDAPAFLLPPRTRALVNYGCKKSVHPARDTDL